MYDLWWGAYKESNPDFPRNLTRQLWLVFVGWTVVLRFLFISWIHSNQFVKVWQFRDALPPSPPPPPPFLPLPPTSGSFENGIGIHVGIGRLIYCTVELQGGGGFDVPLYTIRKVLTDKEALCEEKFSHIEGNSRKFVHIELCLIASSVKLSNTFAKNQGNQGLICGSVGMAVVSPVPTHCPKNNPNLRIETKPVTAGADATVYDFCLKLNQKPNIKEPRCFCSNRDRLGFFAEFQIILGTV